MPFVSPTIPRNHGVCPNRGINFEAKRLTELQTRTRFRCAGADVPLLSQEPALATCPHTSLPLRSLTVSVFLLAGSFSAWTLNSPWPGDDASTLSVPWRVPLVGFLLVP